MPLIRRTSDEADPGSAPTGDVAATLLRGSREERWAAARAIADTPAGVAALTAALPVESDLRVREAIFTGLVRIGTPESARAILPYIRSDDANMRTGALDALRAMPEAVKPHLAALLQDQDADVRLLSCEIARNLPTGEATGLLCALLDAETEGNVCAAAVDVLAEIGAADCVPALMRCAARFPDDPFLGFAVKVAADRLRSRATGQ